LKGAGHASETELSFLILATAASSVWGQVLAPTDTNAQGAASVAGSDTLYAPVTTSGGRGGAEATSSIPDFSGIWARLSFWGFEPPLAGPGPVVNRLRAPNGASSLFGQVGDYSNPILKPQAAEIVKKHGETESSGELVPNPRNMCWPGGVPFVFTNVGMQMIQQADRVMIFYADDHEVRQVRLNQRHPAQVTPSWYGDSVGHYEGDTLVIDTVGVKTDRPLAMVDVYGTPFTQALHVVERYQLLDYEAAKRAEEWGERENFATQLQIPVYCGQ
jgi:hypothetical protein